MEITLSNQAVVVVVVVVVVIVVVVVVVVLGKEAVKPNDKKLSLQTV